MAIFHHLFSKIIRGGHTCAVATAAYRSGSLLKLKTKFTANNKEQELSFDFSKKLGICYSAIIVPDGLPTKLCNREYLWQLIENIENSVNAELACESVFAIPEELSLEQNIKFIQEFIYESYKNKSMVADVNIHNEHANNPHVHIMSPLRLGTCDDKNEIIFSDKFSESFISQHILDIEQNFEKIANKHLELYGYRPSISKTANGIPQYEKLRPWL
jgi:hypothetical protein